MFSTILNYAFAQSPGDSIRNLKYMTVEQAVEVNSSELLKNEQTLKTIFLCGFLLAIGGCFFIAHINKLKAKEYSKIISMQSNQLSRQTLQAQSFGYILNCALFPCCLIDENGKISWQNDAFIKFYGEKLENFDKFSGMQNVDLKPELEKNNVPTSFFVKVKNLDSKVFGFKRTLIPLQGGVFAVVENIEYIN